MRRGSTLLVAGIAAVALASCDSGTTDPQTVALSHTGSNDEPVRGHLEVCKEGTDADFTISVDLGSATTFSVAAGTCNPIYQSPSSGDHIVTVTEVL
ncbi:MAG: hypothetical protein ACC682_12155, partial [Gemmatimonadota bacterium]